MEFAIRKLKGKLTRTVETLMQIKKKITLGKQKYNWALIFWGPCAARRLVGITPMIVLQMAPVSSLEIGEQNSQSDGKVSPSPALGFGCFEVVVLHL